MLQTKGEGEGEVKGLSGLGVIAQIEKKDDDMEESLDNEGVAVGEEKKETETISPIHCEHPESHRAKPSAAMPRPSIAPANNSAGRRKHPRSCATAAVFHK